MGAGHAEPKGKQQNGKWPRTDLGKSKHHRRQDLSDPGGAKVGVGGKNPGAEINTNRWTVKRASRGDIPKEQRWRRGCDGWKEGAKRQRQRAQDAEGEGSLGEVRNNILGCLREFKTKQAHSY